MLGKTNAQSYRGQCPKHFQKPYGRKLNVSFIGTGPYIKYKPLGGSEFRIVNLLAERFRFVPNFIPVRSYDIVEQNGRKLGLLYEVKNSFKKMCYPYTLYQQ